MGMQSLGDAFYAARRQDQVRSHWLLYAAKIAEEMSAGGYSAGAVASALRRAAAMNAADPDY